MRGMNRRSIRVAVWAAMGVAATVPFSMAAEKKPAGQAEAAERAVPAAAPAKPNIPAEPAGMTPMFNGKDLEGWDGDPKLWRVEDGKIVGQTTAENPAKTNTFLIWKGGDVKDFDLRASYKITGGNSGIQYRSKRFPDAKNPANVWVVGGYQGDIANLAGKDGFIYHERGPGRGYADKKNYLCRVGDKVEVDEAGKTNVVGTVGDLPAISASYHKGGWNEYAVIAEGNHLRQYVNGVLTADLTDNDAKNRMASGVVALQLHAGPPMRVEFKDLRVKRAE